MKKIILTRNNESSIEQCINSLSLMDGEIIIGDLQSSDNTTKFAKKLNCNVIDLNWKNDYSAGWNDLISKIDNDWVFLINPGEELCHVENYEMDSNQFYKVDIVSNDWINQSTRIWHTKKNLKMVNPVFEHCEFESNQLFPAIILAKSGRSFSESNQILTNWKNQFPTIEKISYYQSMLYLGAGKFNDFFSSAKEFLFRSKSVDDSVILIWLYMSIFLLQKKDYLECDKWLSCIIAERPWLAEAWCIAGNSARARNHIGRAAKLYELAIACGKNRPFSEKLPMNVKNYKEEPEKFLREFDNIISNILK